MTTHAKLSPSARHRWQLCPASVAACAKYAGEGRSSPAAIDGTHSHTLLETCIKNGKDGGICDPGQFVGTVLQDQDGSFSVDKERAARVRVAVDYIRERVAVFGAGTVVIAEKRVDPKELLGRDDMHGTVDVQIINNGTIEVIDYKDGMGVVEVVGNPQLEQYVYGVLSEHLHATPSRMFNWVITTVIQPKLAANGMPPITSTASEAAEFFGERMMKIIAEAEATDNPNAPFIPGEKQCGWCAHKGNCSAFNGYVFEKSGIKFENVEYVKEAAATDPNTMSDEKLREMVEAGPLLRKMLESAEEEALRRITAGHPVTGLKVVRGPGRREWNSPEDDTALKLTRMGVPKGEVWVTSLISPAKAEKLKWKKRDGSEKQLTEKQLKVLNEQMVSKSEGKLTVVPEADRREGIKYSDVKEMFKPVEPELEIPSWLKSL